jgi:hypothetical protein
MSHDISISSSGSLDLGGSNYLIELAARIKAEHEAVSVALKDSVRHAIEAGSLLLEAKEQVKHGQWLPWLREHCTISERTAQLYMRTAKNREEIEKQIRNGVADLSLNEAAAMLALSSDIKKLFDFVRRADGMDSDELVKHCAENDIAMFKNHPFGGKYFHELDDPTKLEWELYILFLMRSGYSGEAAYYYADHLQSRGWRVTMDCQENEQWHGDWGDKCRKRYSPNPMPQSAKDAWFAFLESGRSRTIADVNAEIKELSDKDGFDGSKSSRLGR